MKKTHPAIAKTPQAPYYAVIFTSQRTKNDKGYGNMAKKMAEMASQQDGFLGFESAHDENLGITISYWNTLESIKAWKDQTDHAVAQRKGKTDWYQAFKVRISKVVRDYDFTL